MPSRRQVVPLARAGTVCVLVAAALLGPAVAQAHARVHPDSTATGSFSALASRVPNASDTAGTVKVTVQLPTSTRSSTSAPSRYRDGR